MLRSLLVFLLLIAVSFEIDCNQSGFNILNTTVACNGGMCIKQIAGGSNLYGCDDLGICAAWEIKAGKCKTKDSTKICCCDTNMCNSAGLPAVFGALTVLPLVAKIFV